MMKPNQKYKAMNNNDTNNNKWQIHSEDIFNIPDLNYNPTSRQLSKPGQIFTGINSNLIEHIPLSRSRSIHGMTEYCKFIGVKRYNTKQDSGGR